jgi:hypothetical protein
LDADEFGRSEAPDDLAPFSPGKSDGIWDICFQGRSTFHNTPPWAVGCQSEENEESLLFLYSPGFCLLPFVETILLPKAIGLLKMKKMLSRLSVLPKPTWRRDFLLWNLKFAFEFLFLPAPAPICPRLCFGAAWFVTAFLI